MNLDMCGLIEDYSFLCYQVILEVRFNWEVSYIKHLKKCLITKLNTL